jgi:hypothetical protein
VGLRCLLNSMSSPHDRSRVPVSEPMILRMTVASHNCIEVTHALAELQYDYKRGLPPTLDFHKFPPVTV